MPKVHGCQLLAIYVETFCILSSFTADFLHFKTSVLFKVIVSHEKHSTMHAEKLKKTN